LNNVVGPRDILAATPGTSRRARRAGRCTRRAALRAEGEARDLTCSTTAAPSHVDLFD
jgi:hypothetical protein